MDADFPMAKSNDARALCSEIKNILVEVCGKTEEEAVGLIGKFWKNRDDLDDDPLVYEELPYYYAMSIIYGADNPRWYKDPNLWPPPKKWGNFR